MGSGDGKGPYRWAFDQASRLFIASDTNPAGLSEIAWRAERKPTRGGVPNLICVAEPLDVLAKELAAVADRLTVILPWGSLLRAVLAPELLSLRYLAKLCLPNASIEIVLSCDAERDAGQGIQAIDEEHIARLPRLYQDVGLQIMATDLISQSELAGYQTTWAKRLAFGRSRRVWRVRAKYAASAHR